MKLKGYKHKDNKKELAGKSTPNTSFSKKSASLVGDRADEDPVEDEADSNLS